jgi:hypothetical protein
MPAISAPLLYTNNLQQQHTIRTMLSLLVHRPTRLPVGWVTVLSCRMRIKTLSRNSQCKSHYHELRQEKTYTNIRTKTYNTTGYVAVDRDHQLIVVAFRGTEDCNPDPTLPPSGNCKPAPDSMTTTPVPHFCPGCEIGTGWLGAWNDVKREVIEAIDQADDENSGFRVVSTGHSLGASLATVAGIELRSLGYTVDIVSSVQLGTRSGRIDTNILFHRQHLHPLEL